MRLTLGLTGMDPDIEAELKEAFAEANDRRDGRWALVPESEADHVVVDMDSMYGPMSWLRLHAADKVVVGMTSAARTQTEFRLARPFDSHQVGLLLDELAQRAPAAGATPRAAADGPPGATAGMAETDPAPLSGMTPAPAPQDVLPEEAIAPAHEPVAPTDAAAAPAIAPAAAAPAERNPVFADWLAPGALQGRVRIARDGLPPLLLDLDAQAWHGPTTLKATAPALEGVVHRDDFTPVDASAWAAESTAAGPAQPLQRLAWLAGLVAGQGALLPDHDPAGRYALTKWPQTEREYPKHFRIATAMMKGPATVADIAEASGVAVGDVADFVNANLVTGFAECVADTPPEPVEPTKAPGLLGRLRNR